jgi:hypothetical protein
VSPFKVESNPGEGGLPKMKGNLGPVKKMNNAQNDKQKERWKDFGKEFDIDNILPKIPHNQ